MRLTNKFLPLLFLILMLSLSACSSKLDGSNNPAPVEEISSAEYDDDDEEYYFDDTPTPDPVYDPFEGFNRVMFDVNNFVFLDILKPIHQGYAFVVPKKARVGFGNFANNLKFPLRLLNTILQLDFGASIVEIGTFFINTVTSLGFADVASKDTPNFYYNQKAYNFGMTMATWGISEGPYLTIPLIGPRTTRGTVGYFADSAMNPNNLYIPEAATYSLYGLSFSTLDDFYIPYQQFLDSSVDAYAGLRDMSVQQERQFIQMHRSRIMPPRPNAVKKTEETAEVIEETEVVEETE